MGDGGCRLWHNIIIIIIVKGCKLYFWVHWTELTMLQ